MATKKATNGLKKQYDKFKQDCVETYKEFKPLMRKLKRLSKRAESLAEKIGKLAYDAGQADALLVLRLGDFPCLVDLSLIDIDATLYNIQHSSFANAVPFEKKRHPCYVVKGKMNGSAT